MKATDKFKQYRWLPFADKMTKEDYRALQAGKDIKVDPALVKEYPGVFKEGIKKEEIKDGNR